MKKCVLALLLKLCIIKQQTDGVLSQVIEAMYFAKRRTHLRRCLQLVKNMTMTDSLVVAVVILAHRQDAHKIHCALATPGMLI